LLVSALWPEAGPEALCRAGFGSDRPLTFLVVNAKADKAHQTAPGWRRGARLGLAFLGMIIGSLLTPADGGTEIPSRRTCS
jgi:hypothetical protein